MCFRDGIANGVILCCGFKNKTPMPKSKQLPELSQFRHFECINTGTNAKKVSDIGEGKKIPLKPSSTDPTYVYEIVSLHQLEIFSPQKKTFVHAIKPGKTEKVQQPAFEDQGNEPLSIRKGAIFKCTKNDLCEARFL